MKNFFRAALLLSAIPVGFGGCSGPSPAPAKEDPESCTQSAPHLLERELHQYAPYQTVSVPMDGGIAELHLSSNLPVTKPAISEWVEAAARAVSTYHGRFPVQKVAIFIVPEGRQHLESAKTIEGRLILIKMGRKTTPADLRSDWSLTHEMFHLAFPDLARPQLWMEEGMATYLEPLARARVGLLSPEQVWTGLVAGIPKGLPKEGNQGLDQTKTWGSTYWGGALFWLLADLDIREQSQDHYSLDDSMREILGAGGNGSAHWNVEQVLDVGDCATGLHVLRDLYQRMGKADYRPNLEELWRRCGIRVDEERRVIFDNESPESARRRSMTALSEPFRVKPSEVP